MADRTMTTECPRRAERLSRELGDGGKGVCPSGELVGTAPWVRYLPSIGPRSFFAVARKSPCGIFNYRWLRVSGTTEMPQIDQCVGHQFHAVVSLLFELEAQQQPLEFIFPREGPLHA